MHTEMYEFTWNFQLKYRVKVKEKTVIYIQFMEKPLNTEKESKFNAKNEVLYYKIF